MPLGALPPSWMKNYSLCSLSWLKRFHYELGVSRSLLAWKLVFIYHHRQKTKWSCSWVKTPQGLKNGPNIRFMCDTFTQTLQRTEAVSSRSRCSLRHLQPYIFFSFFRIIFPLVSLFPRFNHLKNLKPNASTDIHSCTMSCCGCGDLQVISAACARIHVGQCDVNFVHRKCSYSRESSSRVTSVD